VSAMDDAYALVVGIADYRHVTGLPPAVRNDARDVRAPGSRPPRPGTRDPGRRPRRQCWLGAFPPPCHPVSAAERSLLTLTGASGLPQRGKPAQLFIWSRSALSAAT